jgi:hypothetical protein
MYFDTKNMSKTELITTFFDNPTEARKFFKDKINTLLEELIYLKGWISRWVVDMNTLEREWDRILGVQSIRMSDNYKDYVNKQKELKEMQYLHKLSLSAFSKGLTGCRTDCTDELVNRAKNMPIIDIAGRYVEIKKNTAICPFHNEKTASLRFYPKDNGFYCFGCKASGDVISFVMLIESMSFMEAVKFLTK